MIYRGNMLAKEDLMLQERKNEVAEITKTNVRKPNDGNKGVHRLVSGVLSKGHEQGVVLQVVDTRDGSGRSWETRQVLLLKFSNSAWSSITCHACHGWK